jgi:hypothetical protein
MAAVTLPVTASADASATLATWPTNLFTPPLDLRDFWAIDRESNTTNQLRIWA